MTISAESTAVSVRYVSSEKSSWPGVSSRLTMRPSYGNCITDEVTEMPRCCSSAIQSEVAWRAALRPFTVPASWIAPPNSSNFSVSVVLPASGWEMMAKVRRRWISAPNLSICLSFWGTLDTGNDPHACTGCTKRENSTCRPVAAPAEGEALPCASPCHLQRISDATTALSGSAGSESPGSPAAVPAYPPAGRWAHWTRAGCCERL